MDDRIALTVAARLCGDSPGTYRAVLSEYLPKFGVKQGKERRVNVWEVAALRTLTELSSAKMSLKEAAQRMAGLLEYLRKIVDKKTDPKAPDNTTTFAVEMWGFIGGAHKREGYVVEGEADLAKVVAEAASLGWPNVRVTNLTHLLNEVAIGWHIAVDGPEAALAWLQNGFEGKTEAERAADLNLFSEMASRLDPLGERRSMPPSRTNWQRAPKQVETVPAAA
jgi:hypothetical protein